MTIRKTNNLNSAIGSVFIVAALVASNQTFSMENNIVIESNILKDSPKLHIFNNGNYIFYSPYQSPLANTEKNITNIILDEEKRANLKKLEQIASLPNNWNENGANAFSKQLLSKVRNLIIFLNTQPEIFPTACDTIQLEYDKNNGAHLEIEIGENDLAEVYLIKSNGEDEFKNVSSDVYTINKVVEKFYE